MRRPADRDGDGVVGFVWVHGVNPRIRALCVQPTDEQKVEWARQTHVMMSESGDLSWFGAAIAAAQIQVSAAEQPLGILLIECRVPDSEIALEATFTEDASSCGILLEGR